MSLLTETSAVNTAATGTTTATATAPAATVTTTAQGTGTTATWRDALPEDVRANPAISQFEDVPSLVKSYINAQQLVGKKGVLVPGEKSTDEEWGSFFKQIGQPEFDKYEVPTPEGVQINQDMFAKFKENAYKAGLLPKQAKHLFDWYTQTETQMLTQAKQQKEQMTQQQIQALKAEWGDGFEKQVGFAQMAVKELGGEEFLGHLKKLGVDNDVQIAKFMSKVGKLLGEDKLRGSTEGKFGQTPQELDAEIQAMYSDVAYMDPTHNGHKKALQKMERLHQMRYGV